MSSMIFCRELNGWMSGKRYEGEGDVYIPIQDYHSLPLCHAHSELETLAMDRAGWRSTCKSAVEEFEVRRIQELEAKRDLRKSGPPSTSNFECQICRRMCRSRIGLLAHATSPTRDDETHRIDGLVHDHSLHAVVIICSTLVNTQTDTRTDNF